jgi:TPR repeat protein
MDFLNEQFKKASDFFDQGKYQLAFPIFLKLAESGHASSQNNLGTMYESGQGVEPSSERALYWYRKAIRNGGKASIYNLADFYRRNGRLDLAKIWFKKAAAVGDGEAAVELSKLYMSGRITRPIAQRVYELLSDAANPLNSDPENVEEAMQLIEKLKSNGYV